MNNQNGQIFQTIYSTVAPAAAKCFRKAWIEKTGLSERTFRHRMQNPELNDVLLFCHVCNLDIGQTLKPFSAQFKNVPQFNKSLQLSIPEK